jgi:hypothetical protein
MSGTPPTTSAFGAGRFGTGTALALGPVLVAITMAANNAVIAVIRIAALTDVVDELDATRHVAPRDRAACGESGSYPLVVGAALHLPVSQASPATGAPLARLPLRVNPTAKAR